MKTILDVSNIIYAGDTDRRLKGFPIGGIRKILGMINADLNVSDFFICFDGGSKLKKELLPVYKAGRVPDYSVMAQIDLLKQILIDCGIPFYWELGYEADDWIYSLCHFLSCTVDDEQIVIKSNDRDLSCCVTDNITQQPVTSDGKIITKDNFSRTVVNGTRIPYNTIILWKMFHGDASDSYTGLKIPGLSFEMVAKALVDGVQDLIENEGMSDILYSNPDIIHAVLEDFTEHLSDINKEKVEKQLKLVLPIMLDVADCDIDTYLSELETKPRFKVENDHLKICNQSTINKKKFDFYCTVLGLNRARYKFIGEESPETQEFYKLLELQARELSQGGFAVKYSGRKRDVPEPVCIENMSLPV